MILLNQMTTNVVNALGGHMDGITPSLRPIDSGRNLAVASANVA